MNIAEKLTKIAENTPKVYEDGKSEGIEQGYEQGHSEGLTEGYNNGKADGYAEGYEQGKSEADTTAAYEQGVADGKQAEYDEFWDVYQDNGARGDYQYAFAGSRWRDVTFKPKYNLVLASGYSGTYMFYNSRITNIEERLQDLGIVLDTSKSGYLADMFYNAQTEAIPVLDIRNSTISVAYLFRNCTVKTIRKLIVSEAVPFVNSTFQDCKNLENIIVEGVIGVTVNFQWSPLSVESMKSIISCLKNYSGTSNALVNSITFSEACWAALEADSVAPDGGTWREYVQSLGWNT